MLISSLQKVLKMKFLSCFPQIIGSLGTHSKFVLDTLKIWCFLPVCDYISFKLKQYSSN